MMRRIAGLTAVAMTAAVFFVLTGCGGDKPKEPEKKGAAKSEPVIPTADNKKNPLAKHIEVAGLRMSEKAGGKLVVKMSVINHSQAEIGDLALEVVTPGCTVPVKIGGLGPEESKDASGECATTMRVYELPDWQFIRPSFKITSPAE